MEHLIKSFQRQLCRAAAQSLAGRSPLEAVGPNERNDRLGAAEQKGFLRQKTEAQFEEKNGKDNFYQMII
jgi:hypothetical protein